ncbi:chromate efflux transporter [Devosia sp. ZB163]|uniref:chromate efflux transporter n=1 Tax=Devosia sp. ZB163 TaxID=3025938 RepID=UPI00235FFC65|nr:chromate efflux transporter [Devosia sp. ZB163]MDC9824932.1 chromate efflux transporter [Devosia sp. ZB163]
MQQTRGTVSEVFRAFLLLGLTSFGGPVAHLGFFRTEFVERRKWLDDAAYADLVALCQFLPGPASSQVGIGIGKLRAGYWGGIAAFVAFTAPSVILLLAFAFGATRLAGPLADGALHGLKVAALAVVAQAVWAMSRSLTPDWPRRILALAAAAIALLLPTSLTQVALIAGAAIAGYAMHRREPAPKLHFHRTGAILIAAFFVLLAVLPLLALTGNPVLVVAEKFYRTGSLVFGGGHVVLPLLEAELVAPGLISRDLFLAGYGAAQAVPGPLFSFAAYTGALLTNPPNGLGGALLALGAIYLPSFLLVFGALPYWQGLRSNPRLRGGLDLANAVVVGLLVATLYDPVLVTTIGGPVDLAWAAALLALLVWRAPPWAVVLLSTAIGVGLALA